MFKSARIKLTAWYLLIIMFISILFSIAIYSEINSELGRVERFQNLRRQRDLQFAPIAPPPSPEFDRNVVAEAENRITLILVLVNFGILVVSGGAAYFLAGRTLKPIKEMVDEQNRFITDSSHELRTPLTSLRSEIEVNLRDKNLSIKDAKKLLESNLEDVISLQSLSDNLMLLSQYQKQNDSIPAEKLSIQEIVSAAYKNILPQATKKNINIKNYVKDYTIEGNKQNLIQVVTILLDNAVKYSNKNKQINLTSAKKDHKVLITIKDQGIGIKKEDIPHIFDRFYRADKSRSKEKITGYGLGLSIAKRIIDTHNGIIRVESKPKKGSEFTVEIPEKNKLN